MLRQIYRILISAIILLTALGGRAESWRLHPSYAGSLSRIVDTPNYTYLLSYPQKYSPRLQDLATLYLTLFQYDKEGDEMQALDRTNRLSDNIVCAVEYNPYRGYLMVVYNNGNIDLLHDDGSTTNIIGLMQAGDSYETYVNSIVFHPEKEYAYLATRFGYVVINDRKGEVTKSRIFDKDVRAVAPFGDRLIVGTRDGLYEGTENMTSLSDFEPVEGFSDIRRLAPLSSRLYVLQGEDRAASLDYLTIENGELLLHPWRKGIVNAIERYKNGLLFVCPEPVIIVSDKTYDITQWLFMPDDIYALAGGWNNNEFWVNRGLKGIVKLKAERKSGRTSWTVLRDAMRPNASAAFKCTGMAYSPTYGMLVRNHGIDWNFTTHEARTPDQLSGLKNMEWKPLSQIYTNPDSPLTVDNPSGITIDPDNPNWIYTGSMFSGILRLDLENPSQSLLMSHPADPLASSKGYVKVAEDSKTWSEHCYMSQPKFDNAGRLWTVYYDLDHNKNGDYIEFRYWTPEARKASTTPSNFRKWNTLTSTKAPMSNVAEVLPLRASNNANILAYRAGQYLDRIMLLNHGGTPETPSDDRTVVVQSLTDQDGNKVSLEYTYYMWEDPNTGNLWLSTTDGICYFSPTEMLQSGQGNVRRPKVARNDGTNFADFLLAGVGVNAITVDSQGRKWFATRNGGLVCTSADGTHVYKTYTAENSLLPSDMVYAACYNPSSNSIMLSTANGLAELFLSGSGASGEDSDVRAYPNPVRPDYYGYVTIDGLEDNALVKITDNAGHLIKELGMATGGEVEWDVTNMQHKRVPAGVYYIMCSGSADSSGFAAVGKILVVK